MEEITDQLCQYRRVSDSDPRVVPICGHCLRAVHYADLKSVICVPTGKFMYRIERRPDCKLFQAAS